MKRILAFALVLAVGLLTSCPETPNGDPDDPDDNPVNPVNPNQKATIVFDNTDGICAVTVYSSYLRGEESRLARIPAGRLSQEFEWLSGSMTFFYTYQINFKDISGLTIDYTPAIGNDQNQIRIDPNKKTVIPIPPLDDTLPSPDTLLSKDSYLLVQNDSYYSLQLLRGSSVITPNNISETLVNSGERALYTVAPGPTSNYKLQVSAASVSLPAGNFEAGHVYSFVYANGALSQGLEIAAKLENVAEFSPDKPVPQAPGAPVLSAQDGSIIVQWTAVADAESYEVYRSVNQNPPNLPVKTVYSNATVFTGLTNKTTYYVWIRAVDKNGASDFSPRAQGVPWPINDIPATPGSPMVIPGVNQLTVSWEECGGASSYEVHVSKELTAPSETAEATVTSEKTSAVITNLENNSLYFVWVRAVNKAGKSPYSTVEAGTPKIPTAAPAAPAIPVLTVGSRELAVSWQAVEFTAAYEVWFGTTDNAGSAVKYGGDITGGATEKTITGLSNETTYYVWIKAKNVAGTSGFSLPANAKPSAFAGVPETPDKPAVVSGNRELSISWQTAEGALLYEVWTGTSGNSAYAVKRGADLSGTSTALGDLNNGTTYYVWLKAKNDIGTSGFSPAASGIPSASTEPPAALENAPFITAGNGMLFLSWQAVEGASAYEIWAGTSSNSAAATKRGDDVSALSVEITDLNNETTYYVWVKAKNSKGTSGFSPAASGKPSLELAAADVIIELSAVNEWELVSQTAQTEAGTDTVFAVSGTYETYRWYLDGISVGTESSYTFNKPAGVYELVIVARNSAGEGRSGSCRVTVAQAQQQSSFYEMVFVPGGSFEMGKNLGTGGGSDVTPVHTVTLSGFYMGKYEVTQAQWQEVMGSLPSSLTSGTNYGRGDNYPVYYVTWYDALVFCNKLSITEGLSPVYRISGSTNPSAWGAVPTSNNSTWNAVEIVSGSNGYRLPTEAQWEYAAKGGNGSPGSNTYSGSNTAGDVAWYSANSGGTTHEVGTKAPNGLGIYDMSGNVWEWCWDWYGNYASGAQTDPTGASSGTNRMTRGGARIHSAGNEIRSVSRFEATPSALLNDFGFRLVRWDSTIVTTHKEVTVAMWDSRNDGWDTNAALRINVNGTDISSNVRIGNSPGYYTFTVNAGDVVTFYWVNGGSYDYECAFAVYYSADPPNPEFNPATGAAVDSARVLLYRQYRGSGAFGSGTLMGSFTVPQN